MKKTLLLFIVLSCMSSIFSATTLTVGSGYTYATVYLANAAANDGDIIHVYGSVSESAKIVISKSITIEGDGPLSSTITRTTSTGNTLRLIEASTAGKTLTIKNLTVTQSGIAGTDVGMGVYCTGSTNSLTVDNVVFNGFNSGSASAGALWANNLGNCSITNCEFKNNTTTTTGGAIMIQGSSAGTGINKTIIDRCTFEANNASAANSGHAIILSNVQATASLDSILINNCTFYNNGTTANVGATIRLQYHGARIGIKNCTFANNNCLSTSGDIFTNTVDYTVASKLGVIGNLFYKSGSLIISGTTATNGTYKTWTGWTYYNFSTGGLTAGTNMTKAGNAGSLTADASGGLQVEYNSGTGKAVLANNGGIVRTIKLLGTTNTDNKAINGILTAYKQNSLDERGFTRYSTSTDAGACESPKLLISSTTKTGFGYTYGAGPSGTQSFNVSGVGLLGDITISPTTNYELSTQSGLSFVATNPIILSKNSSTADVALTLIYIRLKAGLSATDYNSETVNCTASSAATVSCTMSGTVSTKGLIITATGPSKTYGTALTAGTSTTNFTADATGVGSEVVTGLTLTPDAVGLSATSTAGTTYLITPSVATGTGGFLSSNYSITYNAYNGTVAKKSLTITADNKSVSFGTAVSTLTSGASYTPTGFITGEDASVIGGSASYSTTYTNTTAVGTPGLTITPIVTSLTATNYSFTPVAGTVTVTQATPTLSLASSSVNYNGSAQAATVNGSVAGTPSNLKYDGSSTSPTAVGSYAVTADFAPTDGTNYASLTGASAGTFNINATVPDAPIVGTATAGNTQVSVAFTAPSNNGGSTILDYTVTPYVGAIAGTTVTGSSSPIVVTGLANGTTYTFTITARNSVGSSSASSASNSATPVLPSITVSANANLSTYSPSSATDVTVSAGELTVDDDATVKTMTVAPGAKLTLASGKTLTVVGALTILSDATGTGTFVDNGGTLSAGSTDVQRYLKGGRNWYISSPVSAATANVFNVASSKDLLYNYSESTGTNNPWPLISNGSTVLNVMQGYVTKLNADTTINFIGTLNTGDQTISFNRTTGQTKEGFNLVGNPYVSYVNIKDIQTSDSVHLETSYWLRSRNSGNTAYVFDTYNLKSGMGVANSGLKLTKYIPPMQAFWVRVKKGFGSGSLTLHNSLRAHQDSINNVFRVPASIELTQQTLRLQVSNGVSTDETLLYTNSNASNGFDDYDSQKMNDGTNVNIPQIFTLAGTEQLAINGLNTIPYDTEMPIGITTSTSGTYSLKASQISNFVVGTQIILKDYLDSNNPVTTDLSDGSNYSFNSGVTSNNTGRFTLTFKAPSVTTGISTETNGNVWISTRNGQIVVNGTSNNNTTLDVFNTVGQKVISLNLTGGTLQPNTNLPTGAYLVKLTNDGKSITKKIIVD